jgi:hypothetical protein
MTAAAFALLVALGSVVGVAIVLPDETMNAVTVFALINGIFSALVFGVSQTVLEFVRPANRV